MPSAAIPLPKTHLSLHRYGQIMQLNPLYLAGAKHDTYFREMGDCSRPFPRHSWQSSTQASQEDILLAIQDAEKDIADWLNYNVAPDWSVPGGRESAYPYPQYHGRHFTNGINIQSRRAGVSLLYGKLIAGGRRATSVIEAGATVVYSDEDSDSFKETATITVATSITDEKEIKLFHAGMNADERWEIRPIKSISISGGVATIKLYSWLLIDPDKLSVFPTTQWEGVDASDTNNFLTTVDVYRVYNDTSQASCQLIWERRPIGGCSYCGGIGCAECNEITQDGCITIRDMIGSIVVPIPGTYDSGWTSDSFTIARSPDKVKFWYYSGNQAPEYVAGYSLDPLDSSIATAIAYLATARVDADICVCNNDLIEDLQDDMAFASPQGNFLAMAEPLQTAPFGSRRGEWMAYQRLKRFDKFMQVYVI